MDDLLAALARARSVFVLTGAGMSAESGLPTFRGAGGYWNRHRVEDLASPEGFARDPRLVWRWYNERIRAYAGAGPNAGHAALAAMAPLFERFTLATQNVDSLHARAGSDAIELHGHLREARCTRCEATHPIPSGLDESLIAHECGGLMRPQVVWFGEMLPADAWERASQGASEADAVLVIGTSSLVYPAAALATMNRRAFVAEINPAATPLSERAGIAIRQGAADILPRVVEALRSRPS